MPTQKVPPLLILAAVPMINIMKPARRDNFCTKYSRAYVPLFLNSSDSISKMSYCFQLIFVPISRDNYRRPFP